MTYGRGREQADKEPEKEEDKGILKKMLASFDDEDSGEGNTPLERAGERTIGAECAKIVLGCRCAEHVTDFRGAYRRKLRLRPRHRHPGRCSKLLDLLCMYSGLLLSFPSS